MKAKFFIDSFTTLTPILSFAWVSKDLTDKCILVNEMTMEVKEENISVPVYIKKLNGVKFRVSVVPLFGIEFLRITWTTKMLGARYFEGINLNNFFNVFTDLMKDIGCGISYNEFLMSSNINDIDVTGDFQASDSEFKTIVMPYNGFSGSKLFYATKRLVLDKNSVNGLQLVNRKDASIKFPFVKFYSKKDELLTRSKEFYDFLLACDIQVSENHRRVEVTLKNKKHIENVFKNCGFEDLEVSISRVLSFDQDRLSVIVNHLLSRYHSDLASVPLHKDDVPHINPSDYMLTRMAIEMMKEQGYTLIQVLNLIEDLPSVTPTAKSRIKARLTKTMPIVLKMLDLQNLRVSPKDAFFPSV